jgi:hypothetical protein
MASFFIITFNIAKDFSALAVGGAGGGALLYIYYNLFFRRNKSNNEKRGSKVFCANVLRML